MTDTLCIKRTHGLGNVLLLLPVLERLRDQGRRVTLITRPEWAGAVRALVEGVSVRTGDANGAVDLDALTLTIRPREHRTFELARLLGVQGDIPPGIYAPPAAWGEPFAHLAGATVFAPEAGHPAREWPGTYAGELCRSLAGAPLVVTGVNKRPELECDADLRGTLSVEGMLGLLSVAGRMITMDSGALHMATSVGLPVVAVFGGVDPQRRIRLSQRAVALQSGRECAPCDKNETCRGAFHCLRDIAPGHVLSALHTLERATGLVVRRIEAAS